VWVNVQHVYKFEHQPGPHVNLSMVFDLGNSSPVDCSNGVFWALAEKVTLVLNEYLRCDTEFQSLVFRCYKNLSYELMTNYDCDQ